MKKKACLALALGCAVAAICSAVSGCGGGTKGPSASFSGFGPIACLGTDGVGYDCSTTCTVNVHRGDDSVSSVSCMIAGGDPANPSVGIVAHATYVAGTSSYVLPIDGIGRADCVPTTTLPVSYSADIGNSNFDLGTTTGTVTCN